MSSLTLLPLCHISNCSYHAFILSNLNPTITILKSNDITVSPSDPIRHQIHNFKFIGCLSLCFQANFCTPSTSPSPPYLDWKTLAPTFSEPAPASRLCGVSHLPPTSFESLFPQSSATMSKILYTVMQHVSSILHYVCSLIFLIWTVTRWHAWPY